MRRYGFWDDAIEVTGGDAALRTWLDEFLSPSLAADPGAVTSFRIAIDDDRTAWRDAASAGAGRLRRLEPCFALDRGVRSRPAWSDGDATWIASEKRETLIEIRGRRARVLTGADGDGARMDVLRLVREAAVACARADDRVAELHAAALERDGRVLLLAGAKGAGKTTSLCAFARGGARAIVANDRVVLRVAGDAVEAGGVPTIVRVRAPTVDFFADRLGNVPRVEGRHRRTLAEAGDAPGPAYPPGQPLRLSPPQLARALGTRLAASGAVAAIAFPSPAPDASVWRIRRLDPGEALLRLREARFGIDAGERPATMIEKSVGAAPGRPDPRLEEHLAASLPCYAFELGAAGLLDGAALDEAWAHCAAGER